MLAWLVAVTFSYAMNSFITFGPESGRTLRWRDLRDLRRLRRRRHGGEHRDAVRAVLLCMPVLVAKLLSIVVSFVVNFSLSHFVVFRTRRRKSE